MKNVSAFFLLLGLSGHISCRPVAAASEDQIEDPLSLLSSELPAIKPRIVNGSKSDPSNRPFFARAGYDEYYFTNEILCGATLIWSDIVITAAHCQGAFNSGALILDSKSNDYTRLVPIDRQIRHPEWSISRQQLNYDVLVMRLTTPLASTDVAKPISINSNSFYPSKKQSLKAYGFGLTETNAVSDYLREADVTYISNDECWGRGISFNNVLKSEEVMCTDPFKDLTATCLGDSGGPLTDASGTTLVGVISFGSGCEADEIPDGHVRISEVSDWVQEQVCLLSANPPDNCGFKTKLHDPNAVEVVIDFTHDFYPEHTTFAVRSKTTLETVYAGPEYIPTRNGNHKESALLSPGEYTFDVFDIEGNGLVSDRGNGSWKLSALYDGCTETQVATGGPSFTNQQATKFVVAAAAASYNNNCDGDVTVSNTGSNDGVSEAISDCVKEKDIEMAIGATYSTTCDCTPNAISGEIELSCIDAFAQSCAHNHQSCTSSSDCCSGRRCSSGQCRSSAPTTAGRDDKKLGGTNIGGAAARSGRNAGNLRRK